MNWYDKSKSFEKNARKALEIGLYDLTCFSCQQAVELYLKGKIIDKSGSKQCTHSLVKLLKIIKKTWTKVSGCRNYRIREGWSGESDKMYGGDFEVC